MSDADENAQLREEIRLLKEGQRTDKINAQQAAAAQNQELQQQLQEATQQLHQSRQQTQLTTLNECLICGHDYLQLSLRIKEKNFSTKGKSTDVAGKYRPLVIEPCSELQSLLNSKMSEVFRILRPTAESTHRHFDPVISFQTSSQHLSKALGSEDDTVSWIERAVQTYVTSILGALCKLPEDSRGNLRLASAVQFENHGNTLEKFINDERGPSRLAVASQASRTSTARRPNARKPTTSVLVPEVHKRPSYLDADQMIVMGSMDGKMRVILVAEFKPPHKLASEYLKCGIHTIATEEVLRRVTIPTAIQERFVDRAEDFIAKAITQAFDAMVSARLHFGYITTGEVYIWLYIPPDKPNRIRYFLTFPGQMPRSQEPGFNPKNTAVAQLLAMCLLACSTGKASHDWQQRAKKYRWVAGDGDKLDEMPSTVKTHATVSESEWVDDGTPVQAKRQQAKQSCKGSTNANTQQDDDDSDEDDLDEDDSNLLGARPTARRLFTLSKPPISSPHQKQSDRQHDPPQEPTETREYCTRSCLLSLAKKTPLDRDCPNYASHHATSTNHHSITPSKLIKLLRKELDEDLDAGCHELDLRGARGYLFKLCLLSHGYVFVAKGTIPRLVPELQFEAQIYDKLQEIQGAVIPICLGELRLSYPYSVGCGVDRIGHMLLMSYAGHATAGSDCSGHQDQALQLAQQCLRRGVLHGDTEGRNVLWDEREKRVTLVDFSHAKIVEEKDKEGVNKEIQEEPRSKKRKRPLGEADVNKKLKMSPKKENQNAVAGPIESVA
ncbi:uncharacterized protein KY384_000015 [Bacidia gigantensis]|uniref:uncharacterized protein n=1 Tax=Bacidia gigantensis TaxID=2732470 RepID=UPI001D053F7D|nr:uncharacterized protein KY384_000015 [Bacidia gigantensis]KAG8526422.1 hypothetical protein KY384_000015 [Bacidia gigantensis]